MIQPRGYIATCRFGLTGRVVAVRIASSEKRLRPWIETIRVTHITWLFTLAVVLLPQPVSGIVGILLLRAHDIGIGPRGIVPVVVSVDEGLFPLRIVIAPVSGVAAAESRSEVLGAKMVATVVRTLFLVHSAIFATVVPIWRNRSTDPDQPESLIILACSTPNLVFDAVVVRAVGQIQRYDEPRSEPPLAAFALDFPELAVAARGLRSDDACAIARTSAVDVHGQPGQRGFDVDVAVTSILDIPLLTLRVVSWPLHDGALVLSI